MRKEDKKTIRGQPRRDHDDQSWDLWSRTVFKEARQCDVRDAIAGWTAILLPQYYICHVKSFSKWKSNQQTRPHHSLWSEPSLFVITVIV